MGIEFMVGIGVIAIIVFLCMIYRVADIDKALIITGGKEPKIVVSGGSFVIPIFRKATYFDLCMLTVRADKDEIRTVTSVPIVTDWTAQIRPDTANIDNLKKAIVSFRERGQDGIIQDVKLTLTGAVRDIVASMTPEAVLRDKVEFAQKVKNTVNDEMINMGMELVSLNIQDISDKNGYYDNIAALDMEDKLREAENKRATVGQEVREKRAETEKKASQSELDSELAIAEKQRDNNLKKAGYKAEVDKANADAQIAGKLQTTIRMRDIAEEEGHVEVIRQEQANLAAIKRKEVLLTEANAAKEKAKIAAEAQADVNNINADNLVKVAEREASAIKIKAEAEAAKAKAEGEAIAEVKKAEGLADADIVKQKGLAETDIVKQRGLAEAEIIKQKGLAAAEAERVKLLAMAEGEKALADARASNEKVNYEIEKLKIETNARIEIATKTAQIMADIGKNAEFVNINGSGAQTGGTGNVLLDTLANIPELMKKLDVENKALNGKTFNEELSGLVSSVTEHAKGILVNNPPPALGRPPMPKESPKSNEHTKDVNKELKK